MRLCKSGKMMSSRSVLNSNTEDVILNRVDASNTEDPPRIRRARRARRAPDERPTSLTSARREPDERPTSARRARRAPDGYERPTSSAGSHSSSSSWFSQNKFCLKGEEKPAPSSHDYYPLLSLNTRNSRLLSMNMWLGFSPRQTQGTLPN
jgi:hypothetical protein